VDHFDKMVAEAQENYKKYGGIHWYNQHSESVMALLEALHKAYQNKTRGEYQVAESKITPIEVVTFLEAI
jgi:hypothetical protein